MNFLILGTSEFDIYCANAILASKNEICIMVSMPKKLRPENSYNIELFSAKNNIPYIEIEDINSKSSIRLLKSYNVDYIVGSWPKIIRKEALEIPNKFIIGTHPTDLPFNRGRHPLHWLIALGISKTKLSFFKIDEGVDTGEVLLQLPFRIEKNESIRELNYKMNQVAYVGMLELCGLLESNVQAKKQNHKQSNYWRKRTPHDVTLDLRMSADLIKRLVKSFSLPYSCANLIFRNEVIKITDINILVSVLDDEELRRIEPGRIIKAGGNKITVKVDDQLVELISLLPLSKQLLESKYIHPPTTYFQKYKLGIN